MGAADNLDFARALVAVTGAGPREVSSVIVEQARRELDAQAVWLLLADEEARVLRLGAQSGVAPEGQPALERLPYSSPDPAAVAASTRTRQVISDTSGMTGVVGQARAVLAVPIFLSRPGRLLGVLAIGYGQPHRFGLELLDRAELLSDLAAMSLAGSLEMESRLALDARLSNVQKAGLEVAETMRVLPDTALLTALKRGFHLWPALENAQPEFLKVVFDCIVRQARGLLEAEFAAIGAGDDPSVPFDPWVHLGMAPEVAKAIGHPPRPVATLGFVAREGKKVRAHDIRQHPAYRGLPPHHPPITTLLAVPIRYGGLSMGNLYLANKSGGRDFTEEDELIAELLAAQAALAMQQTYLQSALQIQQAQLMGVFESATTAILFIDATTGQVIANARAMKLLGRAILPHAGREQYLELLRLPGDRPVPPGELPSTVALTGGQVAKRELEIARSDGSHVHIFESAAPVHGVGRRVLGAVVVMEDITAAWELQRFREDFAAMAAHDLRNPIQTILLTCEQLAAKIAPEPGLGAMARRIERSAQTLSVMTQDLLDATQVEAGFLRLSCEPLDVEQAVSSLVEQIRPSLGNHPIEMRFSPGLPRVWADPRRVAQLLTNLLDNAAKHSAEGTPISIVVAPAPEGVQLSIHDRGRGIAPQDLPRIFERYFQSQEVRVKGRGLGLGLFIAKGIVEAHHGRIWAESSLGVGTTFHVVLRAR